MAEGEVVLAAAAGRGLIDALLIDRKRVDGLGPIMARLDPLTPVYAASQAVLDAVAGFHIHRGILAIGRRPAQTTPGALISGLPQRATVLALFGIGNHDNMGGLFRNAAAFGVGAVLLGADCCDPFYRKSIRVSVGAVLTTPFARFRDEDDSIAILVESGFEPIALSPSGRERLADLEPPLRAAILLGAEGPGLPASLLKRARSVSIPMSAGWDSLNVAVTAGIALHHLALGPRRRREPSHPAAPDADE